MKPLIILKNEGLTPVIFGRERSGNKSLIISFLKALELLLFSSSKVFLICRNLLAVNDGITETLKAENQMLRVQRMNAVRETATEIVNNDLIYA